MGTDFVYELAANSGSSCMFQANLHFSNAVVNTFLNELYSSKVFMSLLSGIGKYSTDEMCQKINRKIDENQS